MASYGGLILITSPRLGAQSFDTPPQHWDDEEEHRRKTAESVQQLFDGKINATGAVTLTASAASTTITDRRLGVNSTLLFMPTTSSAALEMMNIYVTAQGKQTATINHSSADTTDRTFRYVVLG
jgi:hypothetical protein